MYDQGVKKNLMERATGPSSSAKASERRSAGRYTLTAAAEVIELGSGARFSTRTTDLGPGGCFVDTLVPFPVGSKVRVSVQKEKTKFECGGVVVYSQAGLGMGIAFDSMKPEDREQLDQWLVKLTGGKQLHANIQGRSASAPPGTRTIDHAALVRLVQLMIGKGILTEAEGSSVLYDPIL